MQMKRIPGDMATPVRATRPAVSTHDWPIGQQFFTALTRAHV